MSDSPEFTCSSCKKEYKTYSYYKTISYPDSYGQLKVHTGEYWKRVCPYCSHADEDSLINSIGEDE